MQCFGNTSIFHSFRAKFLTAIPTGPGCSSPLVYTTKVVHYQHYIRDSYHDLNVIIFFLSNYRISCKRLCRLAKLFKSSLPLERKANATVPQMDTERTIISLGRVGCVLMRRKHACFLWVFQLRLVCSLPFYRTNWFQLFVDPEGGMEDHCHHTALWICLHFCRFVC